MCKGKMTTGHAWGVIRNKQITEVFLKRKNARYRVKYLKDEHGEKVRVGKLLLIELPRPEARTRGGV